MPQRKRLGARARALLVVVGLRLVCPSPWAVCQDSTDAAAARRLPEALRLAHALFRERKFDLAADEYERFLASRPSRQDADDARFGLANSRLFQGRYQDARTAFQEFLDRAPQHARARTARYRLGELSYMLGDLRQSRQALEAFVEGPRHPNLETAWTYLGDVCFGLNDLPAARTAYERALADYPDGQLADRSRFGLGRALAGLGELDAATTTLSALAKQGGADWTDRAWLQLGKAQLAGGRDEAAAKSFGALVGAAPASKLKIEADLGRAEALTRLKRFDEAERLLRPLAEEGAESIAPRALLALATLELRRDRPAAARKLLEQGISQFPRSALIPPILFRLGEALQKQSRLAEARATFLKLAEAHPKDPWADDAVARAASLALEEKDLPETLRLTKAFQGEFPDSPLVAEVCLVEAKALSAAGRPKDALPLLERLVDSGDDAGRSGVGRTGRLSETAAISARYELALAYRATGQKSKADALLATLTKETKGAVGADAQFLMGQNLVDQGRFGDAVAPLRQYLETNPNGEVADYALAHLTAALLGSGQFDQAWRTTAELATRFPESTALPASRLRLAEAALKAGQPTRAAEQFRLILAPATPAKGGKAAAVDPSTLGRAQVGLGRALWSLGKPAEAADLFGQFLQSGAAGSQSPAVTLDLARAFDAAGQTAASLEAYQSVSERYASSPEATLAELARARLLARTGGGEKAASLFTKLLSGTDLEQILKTVGETRDSLMAEQGWALAEAGGTSKADLVFTELLALFPHSRHAAEARFHLAESANQAGQHQEVVRLLVPLAGPQALDADAAQGPPEAAVSRIVPLALYRLGRSQIALGDWDSAAATLDRMSRGFPGHPREREARYLAAEAALKRGQASRAESLFASLEAEPPAAADPHGFSLLVRARHVQSLLGVKKWKEALEKADGLRGQLPAGDPAIAELDFARGRALLGLARPEEARQALQIVIDARKGGDLAAQAHLLRGETYFHQEKLGEALREFWNVDLLYDAPHWQAAALLEAGKIYERMGQWSDAVETYRRLRERFPADPLAAEVETRLTTARKQAQTAGNAAGKLF